MSMFMASSPDDYQSYIQNSRGEFSCAKSSCMKFQNAWVSDRSLCYLASGKPVIVKNTGSSEFLPDAEGIKTCEEKGLPTTPIKLRLVRVDLANEVEVLITNLMNSTIYNTKLFKSLYHQRWGIEENYKRLKQWVEIENFSGKSALSVKQDFYAKIVTTNLTVLMVMAAQKTIVKKTQHHQLTYQINFAQAVSKMKHRIVYLIRQAHSDITLFIKRTILYISQTIEAVRDGRSVPRRLKNLKNGLHFPAYKNTL